MQTNFVGFFEFAGGGGDWGGVIVTNCLVYFSFGDPDTSPLLPVNAYKTQFT